MFAFTACNSNDESEDEIVEVDTNEMSAETIGDLMSGDLLENPDVMCFSSTPVADSDLEVTTYISGNRMRIEYMMIPPIQGQGDLYMVSDGEYAYMWGNSFLGGLMQGFKFPIGDSYDEDMDSSEYDPGEFIDYETPLIDCSAWDVDETYFTTPDDVEFMDLSSIEESMEDMAEDMMESTMDSSSEFDVDLNIDCSMCDMMSGSDKEDCLDSLGC